jgi:REP element-mobilizing transposase RayT
MILNQIGIEAKKCWLSIPDHFQNVALDECIVMPDHIHFILKIVDLNVNPECRERRRNKFQHIIPGSLGSIIRGFKIGVTKFVREHSPGMTVWQRNYYDRIIRDENELRCLRRYIQLNPKKWWDSQTEVNRSYRINLYHKNFKF